MSEIMYTVGKAALLFAVVFIGIGLPLGYVILSRKRDRNFAYGRWRHTRLLAMSSGGSAFGSFAAPACVAVVVLATLAVTAHLSKDGDILSAIMSYLPGFGAGPR